MKDKAQYKIEYADVTREIESNVGEQQRNASLYEEAGRAAQQQEQNARNMRDALNEPLGRKLQELSRRKTELSGILKHLEEAEKEAAKEPQKEQTP